MASSAEFEDKYGKILFGEHSKFHGSEKETDTVIEEADFLDLMDFVEESFGKNITRDIINAFKRLLEMKNKNHYTDVLKPPTNFKKMYRGFVVSKKSSAKRYNEILKIANETKDPMKRVRRFRSRYGKLEYIELPKPIIYRPWTEIQSWTVEEKVGTYFGEVSWDNGSHGREKPPAAKAILECKPPAKDMLFNPNFTNTLLDWQEFEVMRISKSPIRCTVYIMKDDWPAFVGGISE